MKTWMGAAILAGALGLSGPGASAASLRAGVRPAQSSQATDFSAQRRYYRYGHRPYYRPYYYARPQYYRPYPYATPAPFLFGFGFGPSWW